ncbi:MAG: hypothetical protein M3275_06015 [Thermoproteota archaeon]|jgi:hypothetical protein|nr:hypothetical protein [Thermoproteota archaeon]
MTDRRKKEEDNDEKEQVALLWNAVVDLQERVRRLERRLEHKKYEQQ